MTTITADTEALELLRHAAARFDELVAGIREPQWNDPTPCPGWTVRTLVNHVAVEDLWAAELFAGRTIAEVGDRLDGDQLGAVPLDRWHEAMRGALAAAGAPGAMADTVHLSFGDVPGSEYAMQLFADHLVHGWDLAVALGAPAALDPTTRAAALAWFAEREDAYRAAGMIGPHRADAAGRRRGHPAAGRVRPDRERPGRGGRAVQRRVQPARRGRGDGADERDCVFEGTAPPDGRRYVGSAAVRGAWAELFAVLAGRLVRHRGDDRRRRPGRGALALPVGARADPAGTSAASTSSASPTASSPRSSPTSRVRERRSAAG
jgi:uncharacterized protein (TIGR03086 family)